MKRRRLAIHPFYGVLTLVYLACIFWLSSQSDIAILENGPIGDTAANLAHIPLYAGLAWCWRRALSPADSRSWWPAAFTLLGCGVYAVLDEFHQSFVPGRDASIGDVGRDVIGIAAMLLFLQMRSMPAVRAVTASRNSRTGLTE